MGSVCGKASSDPQPAHSGTVPAQSTQGRSSVPKHVVGGAGRTIGSGSEGEPASDPAELRRKAAEAAEKRANANKPTGKLGAQLKSQKKKTMNETLDAASRNELMARNADANHEARVHN